MTCALGIEKVGYLMMCYGVVDAVFSGLIGTAIKWIGRPIVMFIGTISHIGIFIWLLLWEPEQSSLVVFFIVAVLLGAVDAVWVTQSTGTID